MRACVEVVAVGLCPTRSSGCAARILRRSSRSGRLTAIWSTTPAEQANAVRTPGRGIPGPRPAFSRCELETLVHCSRAAVPWVTPVAAEEPQPVRARLVADASAPAPGGTLQVGVLLEIDEGWHVYWKNPGDAGLATEVRLTLPEGLAAGALGWPTPHRFTQPGGLVGYGYERTLLLASAVRLAGPPPADGASLAADTSWLACKEVCLIGSARLEGRWPLDVAAPEFERWRAELPAADPPFSVNVTGGWAAGARRADLAVWLSWPAPPGEVELFPEAGGRLKVASPRVQTRGSLTRVDLEVTKVGSGRRPGGPPGRGRGGPRRQWEAAGLGDRHSARGPIVSSKNGKSKGETTMRTMAGLTGWLIVAALALAPAAFAGGAAVGDKAPDFTLPDLKGEQVALSKIGGVRVLEWVNPDCPFVQRHYKAGTMKKLAADYGAKGVTWLTINSTNYMDAAANRKFAEKLRSEPAHPGRPGRQGRAPLRRRHDPAHVRDRRRREDRLRGRHRRRPARVSRCARRPTTSRRRSTRCSPASR